MTKQFDIHNLGSITVIVPLTAKADKWLNENLIFEDWQRTSSGVAVDSRMAQDIIGTISNEVIQ